MSVLLNDVAFYLIVVHMADRSQQRRLHVDQPEDGLAAHGEDNLVVVPVRGGLRHKGGPQLQEVRREAPGEVVTRPGVHKREDLSHKKVQYNYSKLI